MRVVKVEMESHSTTAPSSGSCTVTFHISNGGAGEPPRHLLHDDIHNAISEWLDTGVEVEK